MYLTFLYYYIFISGLIILPLYVGLPSADQVSCALCLSGFSNLYVFLFQMDNFVDSTFFILGTCVQSHSKREEESSDIDGNKELKETNIELLSKLYYKI